MKLSQRRRQAIYGAVHECIVDARIAVAKLLAGHEHGQKIDVLLAQCGAADAAVKAACGEAP